MLYKEYAVNMLTALIDGAEEMNGHGIKAKCLAVNDAVFDTIRGLVTYLQNSEEIVRCENCEFYDEDERWCRRLGLVGAFNSDGFCSHGERRDDGDSN